MSSTQLVFSISDPKKRELMKKLVNMIEPLRKEYSDEQISDALEAVAALARL